MPLTSCSAVGFDFSAMVYRFTMWNGDRLVDCTISGIALNDLAGGESSGGKQLEKDVQFTKFRIVIEKVASQIFDTDPAARVRLTSKHFDGLAE